MWDIYDKIYAKKPLAKFLEIICSVATLLVAFAFLAVLFRAIISSIKEALLFCAILAVPFAMARLARHIINAPRPYEIYDFGARGLPVPNKRKGGSFPSMHVFCASLIGTVLCFWSVLVGLALVFLAVLIAACRVLLGVHFVRDVVAGALAGAFCGMIGAVLTSAAL